MCIACLKVSDQPCSHRWYQLLQSCEPGMHLGNCAQRIRLQGWETRTAGCPFCLDLEEGVHVTTHRILGSATALPSSDLAALYRPTRSDSNSTSTTSTRFSRRSSNSSDVVGGAIAEDIDEEAADRTRAHRDRNDRFLVYLTADPHEILPSARRNYPTYAHMRDDVVGAMETPDVRRPLIRTQSDMSGLSSGSSASIIRAKNALSRGLRSGMKFGKAAASFVS